MEVATLHAQPLRLRRTVLDHRNHAHARAARAEAHDALLRQVGGGPPQHAQRAVQSGDGGGGGALDVILWGQ